MSRKKNAAPKLKTAYRVVRNSCIHAGKTYEIGDVLPDLPLASLNVHLPNLELVEVEDVCADGACPMPEPEKTVEVITQVEEDGGADYHVLL